MDRPERSRRRSTQFSPWGEGLEGRQLLSGSTWPPYVSKAELFRLLHEPKGYPAVRPNTPVLPYGTPSRLATFIDPSARIVNGYAVIVGTIAFVAPYSTLNAHGGIIKIGASAILDNAALIANPTPSRTAPAPQVRIGDQVVVGYGARVYGPSVVGAYGAGARPTALGPGAVVDRATIEPGSIVSALARVGPGVTLPAGYLVLPGKNVATNREASDPSLGKVVTVSSGDLATVSATLASNRALAQGYNTLYQGQPTTGVSPGVEPTVSGIFNGNLATIEGAGAQPGSPAASTPFLPPGRSPRFPSPRRGLVPADLNNFRARVTGGVIFESRAGTVAHSLGRSNSIRADAGQPITIGSIARTGNGVTIHSPASGQVTIGQDLVVGDNASILGDGRTPAVLGDGVTIGSGAVVVGSSLGDGVTVGDRAYLLNSSFPAGATIPPGAIYLDNQLAGFVEW
ncbi:MAG: carbonic anhydrase/acetyltransferase [Isosphaeraceae bacterium]